MFVSLRPSNSSWAKVLVGLAILLEVPSPKQNIELFTIVAGTGSASLTRVSAA